MTATEKMENALKEKHGITLMHHGQKVWVESTVEERKEILQRYNVTYTPAVNYFKQGDDAQAAKNLKNWSTLLAKDSKTLDRLNRLGIKLGDADTHFVSLVGDEKSLIKAAKTGLARVEITESA